MNVFIYSFYEYFSRVLTLKLVRIRQIVERLKYIIIFYNENWLKIGPRVCGNVRGLTSFCIPRECIFNNGCAFCFQSGDVKSTAVY